MDPLTNCSRKQRFPDGATARAAPGRMARSRRRWRRTEDHREPAGVPVQDGEALAHRPPHQGTELTGEHYPQTQKRGE